MTQKKSWLEIDSQSDFSIYNFPFGIVSYEHQSPRVASIIGDWVIDLVELFQADLLKTKGLTLESLTQSTLNDFIALGKTVTNGVRMELITLFEASNTSLKNNETAQQKALVPLTKITHHLPLQINNYTDFYSSEYHAYNVGCMFRDPANALMPNWKHIPVGYHGRASSIIVSGQNIFRPKGQTKTPEETLPKFGPSQRLDFELEVGFVVGKETQMGDSLHTANAEDHIFGFCLFNDWSARDIQQWEYVPLGPFLSKNFASSISPWIVTLEALEDFRVAGVVQEPEVLPYLKFEGKRNFDINLEVAITPENGQENLVCQSNYKYLYWNPAQQLTHHTINGCNIEVGDLYASGTISGKEPSSFGSMLELAWKGTKPLKLNDGTERRFLHDNDTVTMRGFAEKEGKRVGFGSVTTKILPAKA